MFGEVLNCLLAGVRLGFDIFWNALSFFFQLKHLNVQVVGAALGISTLSATILILLIKFIKIVGHKLA